MNPGFSQVRCAATVVALLAGLAVPVVLRAADPAPAAGGTQGSQPAPASQPNVVNPATLPEITSPDLKGRFPVEPEIDLPGWRNRPKFMPPSRGSFVPNKKSKGLLDNESSWNSITPQDVMDEFIAKQILKMPELAPGGKDGNPALERFLSLMPNGPGGTNSAPRFGMAVDPTKPAVSRNNDQQDSGDSPDPYGTFGSRQKLLKNAREPSVDPGFARKTPFTSIFDRDDDLPTPEKIREQELAHKNQLEAMKKIWDSDPGQKEPVDSFEAFRRPGWLNPDYGLTSKSPGSGPLNPPGKLTDPAGMQTMPTFSVPSVTLSTPTLAGQSGFQAPPPPPPPPAAAPVSTRASRAAMAAPQFVVPQRRF